MTKSRTREYFISLYEENEDPWNYETSEYEAEKYEASLRALPRKQYSNALEIGCSIGVFTEKLAQRCRRLLSIDVSATALKKAQQRCQAYPQVQFALVTVPEEYPEDTFDLTVLSEVGYYLSPEDLAKLSEKMTMHTAPGGHLLLVHWLAVVPGYPLQGHDVHELLLRQPGWNLMTQARTDLYRIDVLERQGG